MNGHTGYSLKVVCLGYTLSLKFLFRDQEFFFYIQIIKAWLSDIKISDILNCQIRKGASRTGDTHILRSERSENTE